VEYVLSSWQLAAGDGRPLESGGSFMGRTRSTLLVAGAAAAAAVVATVATTTVSAASASGAGGPAPAAAASAAPSTAAGPDHAKHSDHNRHGGARRGLEARALHGELVLRGKGKGDAVSPVTVLIQRGVVTKAGADGVTLRSVDGFTHTYAVGPDSQVRLAGVKTSAAQVPTGRHANVLATKGGGDTVRRLAVGKK